MKEILLDLAEVTHGERAEVDEQLVDFGVVLGELVIGMKISVWSAHACITSPPESLCPN